MISRRGMLLATVTTAATVAVDPRPARAEALGRGPIPATVWPPPRLRLDQGRRDACSFYAAMQQLNMMGARIGQRLADQVADEAQAVTVTASRSSDDILRDVLRRHGTPACHEPVPGGATGALAAVRRGPVVADVDFFERMYATDRDGRWRPGGRFVWVRHGIVVRGVDRAGRIWLLNQWGTWFGVQGSMWVTRHDFDRLMVGVDAARWTLGGGRS